MGGVFSEEIWMIRIQRRDKCEVDGRELKLCWTLEEALEHGRNPRGKGVYMLTYGPGVKRDKAITIRSGNFLGKGIMINFCPFCGERIRD